MVPRVDSPRKQPRTLSVGGGIGEQDHGLGYQQILPVDRDIKW